MADETPEEYKRRKTREAQQRFRDRKAAEARGEAPPPKMRTGRPTYTPGPGEESREDRRQRQVREARKRYEASAYGLETREAYRTSEPRKQSRRTYEAKPERKAQNAVRKRQQREAGSVPMNYPKKGRPARMPWLIRQAPQTEEERAAANRARVQKGIDRGPARPFGEDTFAKAREAKVRKREGQTVHPWWRKLGGSGGEG